MSDELPQGWATARIADVTERVPNIKPEDYPDKDFGYVDISSIDNLSFVITDVKRFKGTDAPSRARRPIRPNDIVFSNVRTYLRNIALVDQYCAAEVCSTGFTVLRPNAAVEPRFLFRYVLTDQFLDRVTPQQTGTHYPATSDKVVISEQIPLAPLAEQRRIVAKLETLLGKVDASQQRLAKIPVLLKRFRQSVLAAACSGRLTADWREENPNAEALSQVGAGEPPDNFDLPNSWEWLLSSHAFDFVTSGSRGWARYYSEDGPIFLRVGNLDHDSIQLDLRSIQHVRPPDNAEGKRTRVQVGDLLVSVTADVGMVALVETDIGEAYINQHVALARPNDIMDKRFLAYFLSAKNGGQHQFLNLQRGATKVGLGLDDIKRIWVARPPLPEQQEIVRRVEGLFALADQLELRLAKARGQVDKLTSSLLARAFAGKLVPQKHTDEPAEELLERIRGKAAVQKGK